jgi:hypothetical protein
VFHGNQQELDDEMEEHHKDNRELKDNKKRPVKRTRVT